MSDDRIEAAVRTALEQEARRAPTGPDLLETVSERAERRRRRRNLIGGAVAATTMVGLIGGYGLVAAGGLGNWPGASTAATSSTIQQADEIDICVTGAGRAEDVTLTTRTGDTADRNVETTVQRTPDGKPELTFEERRGESTVRLELDADPPTPPRSEDSRRIEVDGHEGRFVDRVSDGSRLLWLETGVRDFVLTLSVDGAVPSEKRMLDWARKITITEGPEACR